MAEHLFEDKWGEIVDRPDHSLVEIRWFDATSTMGREEFNAWLDGFAGRVEECKRPGVLVDATQFRMSMDNMDGKYRDENIIPRYNAAGVRKFAFLMPVGMPAVGKPPITEGPADYPTAYFGARSDAIAWLRDGG
jgi:hypothetical protein